MNKCIFMGRLTRDPEIRYTQSEKPVAVVNYTLAVDRRYKREGEPSADFINFVAYGTAAEFAEKYFKNDLLRFAGFGIENLSCCIFELRIRFNVNA